jgi:hypothetical protein
MESSPLPRVAAYHCYVLWGVFACRKDGVLSPTMSDRRWTIVLAGLLALAGACKDETPEGASSESKPAEVAGTDAKGTDAKPAEPAKAEAPPAEPPPLGHAVAKVGSLLFFSSTGDVGFELPPVGEAPGTTVNVVGEQDGRLVVETLVSEPPEHHCTSSLDGLADFRLRLYLAEADLLPVLTTEHEHAFADGTKLRLARGVAVPPSSTELFAGGTAVRVPVPAERPGRSYEPGPPFAKDGGDGTLAGLEGHALGYDGRTLDEAKLHRDGHGVVRYGATERTSDALVTVRSPSLELTALVSNERLHATATPGGHFLASPYGAAFAVASDDEDVWGGLTGTEVGEAYGVGGLGLVGTGRGHTEKRYEVKAGTAITWSDGRPAGQVTADHRFEAAPRNEGGRSCFDAPILTGRVTTVTLCFAPGDVGEVEVSGGMGTIGLGSGSGVAKGSGSGFGGRGKKLPQVRQTKAEVKGSLDKDIIRRIVRAHLNEVRYCYNQGLVRDPALSGKVSIQFTISGSGSVSVATVASSTLSDENVASCIAKAVKRWTFPKPEGGGAVVVTYPFVLEPG